MSINSQCRCDESQILEGLGTEPSTGVQLLADYFVKDKSSEVQSSEILCLEDPPLEPQFLTNQPLNVESFKDYTFKAESFEDDTLNVKFFERSLLEVHSLDDDCLKDHLLKLPIFQEQFFGVPSLNDRILETGCMENNRHLNIHSKNTYEGVNNDNVNSEQSVKKYQCLVDFYDHQYQKDTLNSQTLKPINDKPNYKMRQIYKFPFVVILTLSYLAIFSIFLMQHPNPNTEQTSEGGIRLVFHPLFLSVSKPTRINYPGFQPPILSEAIKPCQRMTLTPSSLTRQKLQIFCDKTTVWSNFTTVRSNSEPFSIESSSPCLEMYIESNCYDERQVPNVVHYVWFNRHSLDVYTYLSVISVYKNIRPCLILVHADYLPYGPYWIHLLTLIPNIIHVRTVAPSRIFGRKLGYVQHKSDIARLQMLKAHGGIYFDVDQIALKSFDKFRHHQFVMAHESNINLGNAVIVSKKMAPFLDVWYKNYNSYNPKQWGYHSTFLPLELSRRYPDLIHIENRTFFNPDLSRMSELYSGHVEWSESTAIHLYVRWMKKYFTLNELNTMDTSLGQIARYIMFNSTALCEG